MNQNLTEKIFEQCKTIYRGQIDKSSNVGRWGFECNDGWSETVYELSVRLEALAMTELESGLQIEKVTQVLQVKQKFAQLRVYVSSTNSAVSELIEHYERIAAKTCEFCGGVGSKGIIGAYHCVVCPKCRASLSSEGY